MYRQYQIAHADDACDESLSQLNAAPLLTAMLGMMIAFMLVFSSDDVWDFFQGIKIPGCSGPGIEQVDVTVKIRQDSRMEIDGQSFSRTELGIYLPHSSHYMTQIRVTLQPAKKLPYQTVLDIVDEIEEARYVEVAIAGDQRFDKEFHETIARRENDELKRESRFSCYGCGQM
ncbi:biopolymer transporter ExbD [Undibacterium sp. JH2W]|uniref:biopolymer transporter ExbD n=1 Tax=Undibacterium sp. JH2W TaxID=3413037 RepID=UPI003BF32FC3